MNGQSLLEITADFLQTFVLEPVEKGTRLTLEMNYEKLGWGILGKATIKLMTRGKRTERQLENLKSILEK